MAIGAQQDESRVADWIHAFSVGGLNQLGKLNRLYRHNLQIRCPWRFDSLHTNAFSRSSRVFSGGGLRRGPDAGTFRPSVWKTFGPDSPLARMTLDRARARELRSSRGHCERTLETSKARHEGQFRTLSRGRTRGRSGEDGWSSGLKARPPKPLPSIGSWSRRSSPRSWARRVR